MLTKRRSGPKFSSGELALAQPHTRIGAVQGGGLSRARLRDFAADGGQRRGKTVRAVPRARAAQHRAFKGRHRACIESRQGMFQQCEQRYGRRAVQRHLGGEPRERTLQSVGERHAAGVPGRDIPARERSSHAPAERDVGCDESGRLPGRFDRFTQRDSDRERFFLGTGGLDHGDMRHRRLGARSEVIAVQAVSP
jgi:hypothetical protein